MSCTGCQQRADAIAGGLRGAADRFERSKTRALVGMLAAVGLVLAIGAGLGFTAGRKW